MAKYLISFPSAAMIVPDGEWEAVGRDAHAVIDEAKAAGVYVFGGGIDEDVPPALVSADGKVAQGGYPWAPPLDGGFTVLELPSRDEAVMWPGLSERLIDTSLYSFAGESDILCGFRHVFDENSERCGVINLKSVAPRGLVGCTPDQSPGRKKHHHKNVFKRDFHWAGRECLTWGVKFKRHRRRGKLLLTTLRSALTTKSRFPAGLYTARSFP